MYHFPTPFVPVVLKAKHGRKAFQVIDGPAGNGAAKIPKMVVTVFEDVSATRKTLATTCIHPRVATIVEIIVTIIATTGIH